MEQVWFKHYENDAGEVSVENLLFESVRLMAPFPSWEEFCQHPSGITYHDNEQSFRLQVTETCQGNSCEYLSDARLSWNMRGSASWEPLAYVRLDPERPEERTLGGNYRAYIAAKAARQKQAYEKLYPFCFP